MIVAVRRLKYPVALLVLVALGGACGNDVKFNEGFMHGTPTPASLEISRAQATPLPG